MGDESTRKTQGTGFGLYLCKKIAEDHNADISVTNNIPHGSNFTVSFKIMNLAKRTQNILKMAENKKPSILLVEDEENLHEALKLNLELEGYEVTSAYDGAAALKAIEAEYFDLIILDVMLPEIDGINITETIRLQNNEVPILILKC